MLGYKILESKNGQLYINDNKVCIGKTIRRPYNGLLSVFNSLDNAVDFMTCVATITKRRYVIAKVKYQKSSKFVPRSKRFLKYEFYGDDFADSMTILYVVHDDCTQITA